MEIVRVWRKAISIVKEDDGQLRLCRYDKNLERWRKVIFFATQEDFEDFMEFLNEAVPEEGEEDSLTVNPEEETRAYFPEKEHVILESESHP